MSSSRRSLQIELFGYTLTVVSDASDAHVREVVSSVEAQLAPIRKSAPHGPAVEIALLGALNFAEELHQTKAELAQLRAQVERHGSGLQDKLHQLEVQLGLRSPSPAPPAEASPAETPDDDDAPPPAEAPAGDEARTDIPS